MRTAAKRVLRCARVLTYVCAIYIAIVYAVIALSPEIQWGNGALPANLKNKSHNDYLLPFARWIPRGVTSMRLVEPPIMALGSSGHSEASGLNGGSGPKPIPGPGHWQLSLVQVKAGWPLALPYFALTTGEGLHFRFGARWDDVDHYYTFPSFALYRFAVRR